MFTLIILAFVIGFGIYYVTTLDFEVGSGISEEKNKAKDVDFEIVEPEEEDMIEIEEKKEEKSV